RSKLAEHVHRGIIPWTTSLSDFCQSIRYQEQKTCSSSIRGKAWTLSSPLPTKSIGNACGVGWQTIIQAHHRVPMALLHGYTGPRIGSVAPMRRAISASAGPKNTAV